MRYDKYWELEGQVTTFYNQGKNNEALELLIDAEKCLPQEEFHNHLYEIMMSKADFYSVIKMYNEAIDIIMTLINKGLPCDDDIFENEGIKNHCGYGELKKKNDILLEKFKRHSEFKYEVYLPENFNAEKKYGVFIGFHGDPGNIDEFSEYWIARGIYKT